MTPKAPNIFPVSNFSDGVTEFQHHPEWMAILTFKEHGIPFVLDTGSALSLINYETAQQLKLQLPSTHVTVNSIGGQFVLDHKTTLILKYKERHREITFLTTKASIPNI